MLTQAPVLARPDPEKPINWALGAVITQEIYGKEHPIAYASRTLNKCKRNYTVTEKEYLAVIWSVEKYRGYILGSEFQVITDHSSYQWLHNLKDTLRKTCKMGNIFASS